MSAAAPTVCWDDPCPARAEDAEACFLQNFDPLDPEVSRMTGCRGAFSRDEVISFFLGSLSDQERVYRKAGFQREGILRDAVRDGDGYADDILMSMPEDEWQRLSSGGKYNS